MGSTSPTALREKTRRRSRPKRHAQCAPFPGLSPSPSPRRQRKGRIRRRPRAVAESRHLGGVPPNPPNRRPWPKCGTPPVNRSRRDHPWSRVAVARPPMGVRTAGSPAAIALKPAKTEKRRSQRDSDRRGWRPAAATLRRPRPKGLGRHPRRALARTKNRWPRSPTEEKPKKFRFPSGEHRKPQSRRCRVPTYRSRCFFQKPLDGPPSPPYGAPDATHPLHVVPRPRRPLGRRLSLLRQPRPPDRRYRRTASSYP